jgi:hypothetical protein
VKVPTQPVGIVKIFLAGIEEFPATTVWKLLASELKK